MNNTRDLLNFGYRELDMAGTLLKTLKTVNDDTKYLDSNVTIEFNQSSGNVFLVDEDCNVAMMNGHQLEDWFYCPICGHEGFKEDMEHGEDNEECQEYLKDIGVIA
jgi:hypothetical protein